MPIITTATGHRMPAHTTPDGVHRILGSRPGKRSIKATPFAAANPIIPRSEWADLLYDRSRPDVPIDDQGQEGSCTGSVKTMLERALSAYGQPYHKLARAFVYALTNGGSDDGANPADSMDTLIKYGVCTEATCPYSLLFESDLTPAMYAEAKRFQIEAPSMVSYNSFDELVSGELCGYKSGVTVYVAGDWNTLDADGCPPAYRGVGNHWMSLGDGLKYSKKHGYIYKMMQSWGADWGNDGYCYLTEAHLDNQPEVQMYGIKWPGQDPQDPNLAPAAA